MSKISYANGFCKAAQANGVDPRALAAFMKCGFDVSKFKDYVGTILSKVMDAWNKVPNEHRALVGAGVGAAGGAGIGALGGLITGSGAGKGALLGAGIGGLGGAGFGAYDRKQRAISAKELAGEKSRGAKALENLMAISAKELAGEKSRGAKALENLKKKLEDSEASKARELMRLAQNYDTELRNSELAGDLRIGELDEQVKSLTNTNTQLSKRLEHAGILNNIASGDFRFLSDMKPEDRRKLYDSLGKYQEDIARHSFYASLDNARKAGRPLYDPVIQKKRSGK